MPHALLICLLPVLAPRIAVRHLLYFGQMHRLTMIAPVAGICSFGLDCVPPLPEVRTLQQSSLPFYLRSVAFSFSGNGRLRQADLLFRTKLNVPVHTPRISRLARISISAEAKVGDSQSQKAGEGSTLIQAGGNVTVSLGISYAELDLRIAEARRQIAQEVLSKAQEMLLDAGIQPRPVPIKTLVPLLQYASLEDDESLQARWANLLANAATDDKRVRSFFPHALAQFGPVEARLLDFMNDLAVQAGGGQFDPAGELKRHNFSVVHNAYRTIVNSTVPPHYGKAAIDEMGETLAALNMLIAQGMVRTEGDYGIGPNMCSYRITSLGLRFVAACRQPKKPEKE